MRSNKGSAVAVVPSGNSAPYIRGAGGVVVDGRRVVRWVLALSAVALAALFVLLTVGLVHADSRAERLRTAGVPVTVTITGCRGLASGTGITEAGYACHGRFVLGRDSYDETLHASATLLAVGATVRAVVAPGDPGSLSAAASPALRGPGWKDVSGPVIAFAGLVAVLAVGWRMRPRRAV